MKNPAYVQMMYDLELDRYYVSLSDSDHSWIEDTCFSDANEDAFMDALKQFKTYQRKALTKQSGV